MLTKRTNQLEELNKKEQARVAYERVNMTSVGQKTGPMRIGSNFDR